MVTRRCKMIVFIKSTGLADNIGSCIIRPNAVIWSVLILNFRLIPVFATYSFQTLQYQKAKLVLYANIVPN